MSSLCSSASSVCSDDSDNSVDAPCPSLLDSQDIPVSLRSPSTTQSAVTVSSSSEIPSLSSIVAVSVFTLRHVPKGARDHWSSLLTDVLSSVTLNPTDIDGWKKMLMLPKCILYSPRETLHWRDITHLVKQRIRKWISGDLSELWSDVCKAANNQPNRKNCKSNLNLRHDNAKRARRAVEDGQYRKAIQGVVRVSDDVLSELLLEHPQAPPPILPPSPPLG